jgi:hypothetical protein
MLCPNTHQCRRLVDERRHDADRGRLARRSAEHEKSPSSRRGRCLQGLDPLLPSCKLAQHRAFGGTDVHGRGAKGNVRTPRQRNVGVAIPCGGPGGHAQDHSAWPIALAVPEQAQPRRIGPVQVCLPFRRGPGQQAPVTQASGHRGRTSPGHEASRNNRMASARTGVPRMSTSARKQCGRRYASASRRATLARPAERTTGSPRARSANSASHRDD